MLRISLYISFFSTLLLTSCHTKRVGTVLDKKDTTVLVEALSKMRKHEIHTFYTKASTNYQDSSRTVNFKTSIRTIMDSVVNLDIKYAAIPIVNAVITEDSLKVVNRRDKCKVLSSISTLKEQFGIEFSLGDLEDLLVGSPLAFDPTQTYSQIEDDASFILCTHSKKEIKKIGKGEDDAVIIRYFLSPDLLTLSQIIIESTKEQAIIVVNYTGYEELNGILVPAGLKIDIRIGEKAPMYFEMSYSKTRMNETEEIYFVIPEDYESCSDN